MFYLIKNILFPYFYFVYHFLYHNKKEVAQRKRFYAEFVSAGDLVFDIGANMGNRVEPLVDVGARVIAVEPQSTCSKYLSLRFGKKIEVIKKGISSKKEIKTLHVSKAHVVSTFSDDWIKSLGKSGRFKGVSWNRTVEVEMTTLDKLVDIYGLPSFIKIDVEGYELEVLKGLSKPVSMLSIEYAVPEQLELLTNCINRLKEIYGNAQCNYSIGESMEWALEEWKSIPQIIEEIQTHEFSNTRFGDIYIRRV